jgi:RNA-directed DNA polymerase
MSNLNIKELQSWNHIPWGNVELYIKNLQFQIYACSLEQTGKNHLWNLQDKLLKSPEAKLLSIRRITQDNQGKITPGVDGITFLTTDERLKLSKTKIILDGKASKLRKVAIPKSDGTVRYLGIPTIEDRIRQYLLLLALEPEWEAKFDPNSLGFRPGYSTADAKFAVTRQIQGGSKFFLDADIEKCFDNISHEWVISKLNNKPFVKEQIKSWLRAGVLTSYRDSKGVENEFYNQGTPQGGVISPLLANIALNGIESYVIGKNTRNIKLIRYADDIVIFSARYDLIIKSKQLLSEYLSKMNLKLSPTKTYIGHTQYFDKEKTPAVGLDYLGYNFRNFETSIHRGVKNTRGVKQMFKQETVPSRKSVQRHKSNIRNILKQYKNAPLEAVISRLSLVIRGWTFYFSICKATRVFSNLDAWMFKVLWNWAVKRYKSAKAALKNCFSVRGWAFGFRMKNKIYILSRHDQTRIRNYIKIKQGASIYDSKLTMYFANRLSQHNARFRRMKGLLKKQKYKCSLCKEIFTPTDYIELHHTLNENNVRTGDYTFVHNHCHLQIHNTESCKTDNADTQ